MIRFMIHVPQNQIKYYAHEAPIFDYSHQADAILFRVGQMCTGTTQLLLERGQFYCCFHWQKAWLVWLRTAASRYCFCISS